MKVVATYNIKGGVGKTTSAVNLAHEATRTGARVLLWDLDPQAAATWLIRVKPTVKGGVDRLISNKGALEPHIRESDNPALHLVPADFSLRHLDVHLDDTKHPTKRLAALLEPVEDRYDVVVLDCPPGISLTSESVFGATDALLVPTIPTTLSARTLRQLEDFLERTPTRTRVLPFFSMVDRRKKLQRDLVESLRAEFPMILSTPIPSSSLIERMGVERAAVGAFAPKSAAAEAYRSLWDEIVSKLWR